jgi:hypothetical protein
VPTLLPVRRCAHDEFRACLRTSRVKRGLAWRSWCSPPDHHQAPKRPVGVLELHSGGEARVGLQASKAGSSCCDLPCIACWCSAYAVRTAYLHHLPSIHHMLLLAGESGWLVSGVLADVRHEQRRSAMRHGEHRLEQEKESHPKRVASLGGVPAEKRASPLPRHLS